MDMKDIDRINELYRKKKAAALSTRKKRKSRIVCARSIWRQSART